MHWQPKIFFDLDDVLSTFVPYILYRLGATVDPCDYGAYPPGFGWDFVGAANFILPGRDFTSKSFWDAVTHEMWATVPKSPLMDDLLDLAAEAVGRENVGVITTLSRGNTHGLTGKTEWIENNLPAWIHDQIHLCRGRKQWCVERGNLLIDDAEHNVTAWQKAGGKAITWARPWNVGEPLSIFQLGDVIYKWHTETKGKQHAHPPRAKLHVA